MLSIGQNGTDLAVVMNDHGIPVMATAQVRRTGGLLDAGVHRLELCGKNHLAGITVAVYGLGDAVAVIVHGHEIAAVIALCGCQQAERTGTSAAGYPAVTDYVVPVGAVFVVLDGATDVSQLAVGVDDYAGELFALLSGGRGRKP